MTKIEKKLQKLKHTLHVDRSGYDASGIGKDLNNDSIKHYIKTSEMPPGLDINNFYDISHGGSKGFYVIDGAKYDKILKNIKDQDSLIRKKTLNDLKKKLSNFMSAKKN